MLKLRGIIEDLGQIEQELIDLKREKTQVEHFLALIVSNIGELEVDMTDLYKVDHKKVKLIVDQEERGKVKVFYEKD